MTIDPTVPNGNLMRAVLLRQAAALREQATSLEALAEIAKVSVSDHDEWITAPEVKARFEMGRVALDARGIPKVRKGRAWAWRVADIEQSLRDRAVSTPVRVRNVANSNADPLDALLATGALRRAGR